MRSTPRFKLRRLGRDIELKSANQVAQNIIGFSHEHGDPISNLKLQKLLYYAQAWYLALYDVPLFDDPIEAWVHGSGRSLRFMGNTKGGRGGQSTLNRRKKNSIRRRGTTSTKLWTCTEG